MRGALDGHGAADVGVGLGDLLAETATPENVARARLRTLLQDCVAPPARVVGEAGCAEPSRSMDQILADKLEG